MIFGAREIAYSIILLVIIVLSAFFSGSETAFMRANRIRIRSLSRKGSREARKVESILENPDRLISVILLGNNFVNILGSAIATALFLSVFGDQGILLASLAMTVVLLIFSEITPKTIAAYRAERIAMIVSYPISFLIRVLGPLAHLMSLISRLLLSALRFRQEGRDTLTEEDVESVITMVHKEGFIQESKAKMLVAVMDLDTVPVKKIMLPMSDMEFLPIDSSFEEIRRIIVTKNYTRYPVYEGERENIVGYLHIRDLWRYVDSREDFRIRDCLREAHFIPETKPILTQLVDFQQMHLHIAFVVDEYGTVKGGITLEDIIEEITGDIIDEHDAVMAHVIPVGERSFIIAGNISLRDLGRSIDREFPEEYDTLSGLIYELLDRIPEEGDKVVWQDMQFRIERMRGNRISRVRVTIRKDEPAGPE
jgi:putative hemolysin